MQDKKLRFLSFKLSEITKSYKQLITQNHFGGSKENILE